MPLTRLQLLALLYLIAVAAGIWGYAVGAHQVFPHRLLSSTVGEVRAFLRGGEGEQKSTLEILTTHLQEQRNRFDFGGFRRRDPDFVDPGYLLLPRWSREHGRALVELIRLEDFQVVHRWQPDLADLAERGRQDAPEVQFSEPRIGLRMNHALLLPDGGLVFSLGHGPLARIDRDGNPLWVRGGLFHHAIEQDADGNLVATADIVPPQQQIPEGLIDEGYMVISPDGEVLERRSVARILSENGYDWLLLGMGEVDPSDLLHLNDAQPVHQSGGMLERGDLVLSLRDRSSILVYRPATDRIVAARSGPWMMQHDPDALTDGRILLFDNRAYLGPGRDYLAHGNHSSIAVWDPRTDLVERPYETALAAAECQTSAGGQVTLLPNGDALVEESIWRRLLRISADRVRWEYVNADPRHPEAAGMMQWARYLPPGDPALHWLNKAP